MVSSIDDETEKVAKDKKLKDSEQKFRNYVEHSPIGIFVVQKNGYFIDVNPATLSMTGYSRTELLSMHLLDLFPLDATQTLYFFNKLLRTGKSFLETPFITKGGERKYGFLDAVKLADNQYIGYATDITERKNSEEHIKQQRKQILEFEQTKKLELHHRIKNNLQVISSLLDLQSSKFEEEKVNDAFRDTQNRVDSMALVHKNLYETKNLEYIDTNDYIKELVEHLIYLYDGNDISLNIDIQDINFGFDTFIPLGMIINELISNTLKYAFKNNDNKEIFINLYEDYSSYTLIIGDNGKGLNEDIDITNPNSLGFQLINSLVEQIDGTFELDTTSGTKFIIKF
ncbi:sensor histidine kinase [Methanohalobium sp.]|uniref:sensor histidine kinase n=1 Tax=Methanohalobium sp. TaxID=2837493 RepID=UPI0025D09F9B|nr:histidine kinase dimerization/phosphoacceptor domain -containing protein [Methanohalobium sp.]